MNEYHHLVVVVVSIPLPLCMIRTSVSLGRSHGIFQARPRNPYRKPSPKLGVKVKITLAAGVIPHLSRFSCFCQSQRQNKKETLTFVALASSIAEFVKPSSIEVFASSPTRNRNRNNYRGTWGTRILRPYLFIFYFSSFFFFL